jgi:hypothetical protein
LSPFQTWHFREEWRQVTAGDELLSTVWKSGKCLLEGWFIQSVDVAQMTQALTVTALAKDLLHGMHRIDIHALPQG